MRAIRKMQRVILALFILTLLAFCGLRIYRRLTVDVTPPVITCSTDSIDVSVTAGEEALLRQMRGAPVLTKPADVSRLGQTAQDLFTREAGWTDLYTLAYPDLSQSACGADWRATPWIM